jgi:hypothetical protein
MYNLLLKTNLDLINPVLSLAQLTPVSNQGTMQDEFLTRCVVDPTKRTIYIYSSEGDTKEIICDTVDQFMNVLEVIRNTCPEDALVYAEPLEV